MQIAAVTTRTKASQLRGKGTPVLVIDLGFAAKARSCGLSNGEELATLLLEAGISGLDQAFK